jgi:multiple sugar transport system substrate-binding protein
MSIGSSAGATHQRPSIGNDGKYPFEVGIAPIPQEDPSNPKVISQGPSVCIFDGHSAAEEEASWLFVKFLCTSVEFQADFSMASGYVPVIKSVSNDSEYAKFLAEANGGEYIAALSAKVCLEQADAYYVSPAFVGSSDARDEVGDLLQACLVFDAAKYPNAEAKIKELFEAAVKACKNKQ